MTRIYVKVVELIEKNLHMMLLQMMKIDNYYPFLGMDNPTV